MAGRSNRSDGGGRRSRDNETDASVRRALERAVQHAQLALSEGVASARALLDAASIGVSGAPAQDHPRLSELAWTLDRIAAGLSGEAPSLRAAALSTLLAAIDREVERWEIRSRSDQDARAVLRAFLGLREILWEMGVRRSEAESKSGFASDSTGRSESTGHQRASSDRSQPKGRGPAGTPAARVQRIEIRG
jgi:hypothetical protein